MIITLLDDATLGEGLDFSVLEKFGTVECCGKTPQSEVSERIRNSDVVIINKIKMNCESLKYAAKLKLICVFATGYDNIDMNYCREHGIAVCNVKGYSTDSVAQLTVTMALFLANRIPQFTSYVESGAYSKSGLQNYLKPQFHELRGKTWGIIGFGNIGGKVAKIAEAFGCRVLANRRRPVEEYENASVDEICRKADIISIHTPLTDETVGLIGEKEIALMKKNVLLINVARGAVTDETAVAVALKEGRLGGFAADVYSTEPFPENHPFSDIMHMDNVCLTPHMAWGAVEARIRCLDEIVKNIDAFLKGEIRNRVDME